MEVGWRTEILQMFSDFPGQTERELQRCQLMAHLPCRLAFLLTLPAAVPTVGGTFSCVLRGEGSVPEGSGQEGPSTKRTWERGGFHCFF